MIGLQSHFKNRATPYEIELTLRKLHVFKYGFVIIKNSVLVRDKLGWPKYYESRSLVELSTSYMRSIAMIGFKELMSKHGVNAFDLIEEIDLDPRILTQSNLIYSYQKHIDLWEMVSDRLGEPDIGLKYALSVGPTFACLGPIMILAQFEKTAGGWLQSGMRYLKYHSSGRQFSLIPVEGSNDIIIRLVTDPFVRRGRQLNEIDAALTLLMARQTLNSVLIEPKVVRFPHDRPKSTALHTHIFKSELEFNTPFLETVVSRDFLSIPLQSPMSFARPVAHWFADKITSFSPTAKTSMSHKVRMAISLHLGTKRLNINDVSATLEIHPKQLQRELLDEDQTYSAILEDVREELACSLLETSTVPIHTIAGYLDYSNSSAFLLAFKRWRGFTPTQYRKQF